MSRIDTLDEALRSFSDTRAGLARLIDRCGGDSGANYPGDWHTQLIGLADGALPVFVERDALAAEVEQLTQERETGAALDSEARAHDEIEDYSAAHDEACTTIAELRKGLERIALDLSSASVTDSFYNAIGRINNIERKARALLAKGGDND